MRDHHGISDALRSAVRAAAAASKPMDSPQPGSGADPGFPGSQAIPVRYEIRDTEQGRFLQCDEAPRARVSIDRGHSFSKAEARELGGRVILLDGAGIFKPLLDNSTKFYNLDHHEGCERAFTLATCEQALLMAYSGLELSEGDWTIYANEPDLDTVLAIWCLLNYRRVRELSATARDILLPLVRLEGAIDANGVELAQYCGLPSQTLRDAQQRIDTLIAREHAIKSRGEWLTTDFAEYTLEMLRAVDQLFFSGADFSEYARIEQVYGHVEIGERRVAVVCRDPSGIYEVEQHLKKRWGDQLAIIALEKDKGHYTLRRTEKLSEIDLHDAYEMLNVVDPAVDGRPPANRWGGSDSIGGSPRATGTALAPNQLLRTLRLAYVRPPRWEKLRRAGVVAAWSAAMAVAGVVAGLVWTVFPDWQPRGMTHGTAHLVSFALVAGAASLFLAGSFSERRRWLFGWRRPAGRAWMRLAPLVVLGALPARAWGPHDLVFQPASLLYSLAGMALLAAALEFWFRGMAHGTVMLDARIQSVEGPWFVSRATGISALLYAAVTAALSVPWILLRPFPLLSFWQEAAAVTLCAGAAGLALGMIRERSLSLWPGVLLQLTAGVACAGFWFYLGA